MFLSPLASTLLVIKPSPYRNVRTGQLSQDIGFVTQWDALLPAYSAINLASSICLANASFPPYVTPQWALPAFQLHTPASQGLFNSTLSTVLPGIQTSVNCENTKIVWNSPLLATVWGLETGYSFNWSIK